MTILIWQYAILVLIPAFVVWITLRFEGIWFCIGMTLVCFLLCLTIINTWHYQYNQGYIDAVTEMKTFINNMEPTDG